MKFKIQLPFFVVGLILFSYGIAVAIKVNYLGVHPWDVLNIALFDKIGLTIGTWNVIFGMMLVLVSLLIDRTFVNIGTFINALMVGPMVDFFLWLDVLPQASTLMVDVLILLFGIVIMGIGGGMYNAARIGSGPRDGFMLAISVKLGYSISRVRMIVESIVLMIALLIGGPVFIFTFIFTFIQSPIFQASYKVCTGWIEKLSSAINNKVISM
ncbi:MULTISPECIES: YczE/YyaS/YitT family protein [Mesobacillus]|uniref:Membrane protein n=2 Tax=Mesobacillus TaxID=2675231 RepID=A0A0D6Z468_9BACI|nr:MULTISPECIES: YitT family protein [Mesobacillus]KIY20504.1 membrane protein [Mesobacillus subterraneus]MDQ0415428.1 putative membrane protein YczE [Mesobacillus stamsii]